MPIKVLERGATVLVDQDDVDLFDTVSWHLFHLCPTNRPCAVRKEVRFGREYRVMLHREIGLRMRPELVAQKRRFRVLPKNGDYLDCRRDNLDVVVQAAKRGRKKIEHRPQGWKRREFKGAGINTKHGGVSSALWAGGYQYVEVDRAYLGEGRRIRRKLGGRIVD